MAVRGKRVPEGWDKASENWPLRKGVICRTTDFVSGGHEVVFVGSEAKTSLKVGDCMSTYPFGKSFSVQPAFTSSKTASRKNYRFFVPGTE